MKGEGRRRQLFADRKLQSVLLVRTAIYWFYCLLSVAFLATLWIVFTKQPNSSAEILAQLWIDWGPALLGSILLLPLVLFDCLRLSSRFAGPMVRIKRVMQELAAGENPSELKLRPGDYWSDFAKEINIVTRLLRQQESQTTERPTGTMHDLAKSKPALPKSWLDGAESKYSTDIQIP